MSQYKQFTSPKGHASWPKLTKPDYEHDPKGIYKTGLVVKAEDAEELKEMLKEVFVEEFGAKKLATAKMPYKELDDGTVAFSFKMYAERVDKKTNEVVKQSPKLFDSKGNPIKDPKELRIGGGTYMRVAGAAKAYSKGGNTGVTMYLNSAQILKLVEYGGASPFSADDEGDFEATAEAKFSDSSTDSDDIDF